VVQGSVVAGQVIVLDAMGVVAGHFSSSGVAPAGKSESPSHSNQDDGLYHGRQDLVDLLG